VIANWFLGKYAVQSEEAVVGIVWRSNEMPPATRRAEFSKTTFFERLNPLLLNRRKTLLCPGNLWLDFMLNLCRGFNESAQMRDLLWVWPAKLICGPAGRLQRRSCLRCCLTLRARRQVSARETGVPSRLGWSHHHIDGARECLLLSTSLTRGT